MQNNQYNNPLNGYNGQNNNQYNNQFNDNYNIPYQNGLNYMNPQSNNTINKPTSCVFRTFGCLFRGVLTLVIIIGVLFSIIIAADQVHYKKIESEHILTEAAVDYIDETEDISYDEDGGEIITTYYIHHGIYEYDGFEYTGEIKMRNKSEDGYLDIYVDPDNPENITPKRSSEKMKANIGFILRVTLPAVIISAIVLRAFKKRFYRK